MKYLKRTLVFVFLTFVFIQAYSQTSERPEWGPRSERNVRDELGRKQGVWKYYYNTGEIRMEINYTNNLIEGVYKDYYSGGKVKEECNFIGGKRDGEYKKYFISGQIALEGKYYLGKKDEKWIGYFEDGQIKREFEFKRGVPDGVWKTLDRKGNIISNVTYKNGVNMSAPAQVVPVAKEKKSGKTKGAPLNSKLPPAAKDTTKAHK